MKVLFIVAARGGSKGVPRKNIRKIARMTLISYKIISAQKTSCDKKRIILSTEDEEIAEIGRELGAEVPFKRPEALATDTASSVDVILHAMEWVEHNDETKYNVVFLLEPSSPFGTYKDFEQALDIIAQENVENVVAVRRAEPNSIFVVPLSEDGSLSILGERLQNLTSVRRQDFSQEYTPSGSLYCSKWEIFKEKKTFYTSKTFPVILDTVYAVEIDTLDDLDFARYVVEKGLVDLSFWKKMSILEQED